MADTVPYDVIETVEGVEIRSYPTIILAKVKGVSDDVAFRILFRYITGENKVSQEIAMTAPVISTGPTYQRIAMTRPVFSDDVSFSFVLPSSYSMGNVPQPIDTRIEIVRIGPRRLAVLRFSGRPHRESIQEKEALLFSVLEKRGLKFKGEPFLMRYNGPGTPGFLRRNEVAVELE